MHDKLRLFAVLQGNLELTADIPMKKCTLASFSNGGHMFAVVGRGTSVSIYATYSRQLLATMKGHISTVTKLRWSLDDRRLISVGAGGACYIWDIKTFSRLADEEYVDKTCSYHSVTMNSQGNAAVARTYSGKLQHIAKGEVLYQADASRGSFLALEMVAEDNAVLVAEEDGMVRCLPWPKEFPLDDAAFSKNYMDEFALHAGRISHMRLSADGGVLVTCDDNGVVMVSTVSHIVDGKMKDFQIGYNSDSRVLIHQSEIRSFRDKMRDLAMMVITAKTEAEYQVCDSGPPPPPPPSRTFLQADMSIKSCRIFAQLYIDGN